MRRHVYYYTVLEQPYEQFVAALGDPQSWLPDPARHEGEEWHVVLRAEGALPHAVAVRKGLVKVGRPTVTDERALVSLEWRSGAADRLFPVLSADLELIPLESGCQLSLMGTYRPPLAVMGEATDRLLGHRVAEACVRRFVLDVAERLERLVTLPA